MADKGSSDDGPSLEMPSLRFGRRTQRPATDATAELPTETATETSPETSPETPQTLPVPARDPRAHTDTRTGTGTGTGTGTPHGDGGGPGASRPSRGSRLPDLSGVVAALATGAAMGALGVLLVWLASRGCEAARGTASCGDGPGFLVLVAILAVLAYLGGIVLRAFEVPDGGSTSLLAVGVMAVLVLVLFTDEIFEWWMAVVVPVVTALAYALSWWVTTRVVQTDDGPAPTRL